MIQNNSQSSKKNHKPSRSITTYICHFCNCDCFGNRCSCLCHQSKQSIQNYQNSLKDSVSLISDNKEKNAIQSYMQFAPQKIDKKKINLRVSNSQRYLIKRNFDKEVEGFERQIKLLKQKVKENREDLENYIGSNEKNSHFNSLLNEYDYFSSNKEDIKSVKNIQNLKFFNLQNNNDSKTGKIQNINEGYNEINANIHPNNNDNNCQDINNIIIDQNKKLEFKKIKPFNLETFGDQNSRINSRIKNYGSKDRTHIINEVNDNFRRKTAINDYYRGKNSKKNFGDFQPDNYSFYAPRYLDRNLNIYNVNNDLNTEPNNNKSYQSFELSKFKDYKKNINEITFSGNNNNTNNNNNTMNYPIKAFKEPKIKQFDISNNKNDEVKLNNLIFEKYQDRIKHRDMILNLNENKGIKLDNNEKENIGINVENYVNNNIGLKKNNKEFNNLIFNNTNKSEKKLTYFSLLIKGKELNKIDKSTITLPPDDDLLKIKSMNEIKNLETELNYSKRKIEFLEKALLNANNTISMLNLELNSNKNDNKKLVLNLCSSGFSIIGDYNKLRNNSKKSSSTSPIKTININKNSDYSNNRVQNDSSKSNKKRYIRIYKKKLATSSTTKLKDITNTKPNPNSYIISKKTKKRIYSYNNTRRYDKNLTNLSQKFFENIDTNLSLDSTDKNFETTNNSNLTNNNFEITDDTIFILYPDNQCNKILCFDINTRKYALKNFADFGNFEENFKASLLKVPLINFNCNANMTINNMNYLKNSLMPNSSQIEAFNQQFDQFEYTALTTENSKINNMSNKQTLLYSYPLKQLTNRSLFITRNKKLYIVTGENIDKLYVYDPIKNTMSKYATLNNNHSCGALLFCNNNSLLCISGDYNKKVELFNEIKNTWVELPELKFERSFCGVSLYKDKYIFACFGYNSPTGKYLNNIEYLDLLTENSKWEILKYQNSDLIDMNIAGIMAFNYTSKDSKEDEIIFVGGFNENKFNENFLVLKLGQNFIKESSIEKADRKLKDITKNKYNGYFFDKGMCIIDDKTNHKSLNIGFDCNFRIHIFNSNNLSHDIILQE